MSNSIRIDTFKVDLIEKSGYFTWIDFWLNEESYQPELNRRTIRTGKGELVEVNLPFGGALLEALVMEEYTMVLEHLGCGSFDQFQSLIKRRPGGDGIEGISLVVRGADGSVYLRDYLFNEAALAKLSKLCARNPVYRVWSEKVRG